MINKCARLWIWVQHHRLMKAVTNSGAGTLTIYDDRDTVLLKRTGLTKQQVEKIEHLFQQYCLKQLGENKEPFTYL